MKVILGLLLFLINLSVAHAQNPFVGFLIGLQDAVKEMEKMVAAAAAATAAATI